MLSQLISGLNKAKSQVIPSRRWNLMEAGGNPPEARLPFISGALQLQNNLAIHLMAAALASDAPGVRNLAGVMLKLGAGFANDPNMVPGLTGAALNQITLKALNPALKCSMLVDSDFSQIQTWLGEVDDVWATERMSFDTLLASYTMFDRFKTQVVEHKSIGANFDWRYFLGTLIAPIGWIDANRAFAAEMMLQQSGTGGGETWRSADAANKQVFAILSKKMGKFNPRTLLAQIAVPGMGGMWTNSAENLFRRRCAILTCGLHRHRLLHGSFPTTLVELDSSLLPGPQTDPAKSDAPLNYRLTDSGFLLWSVGLNRADDGGDAGADWIWRHEPRA